MRVEDRPFVVDGPKGSKYFVYEESFYAYIQALRAHGRIVTVDTTHHPVVASYSYSSLPAPTFNMANLRKVPSASVVKVIA